MHSRYHLSIVNKFHSLSTVFIFLYNWRCSRPQCCTTRWSSGRWCYSVCLPGSCTSALYPRHKWDPRIHTSRSTFIQSTTRFLCPSTTTLLTDFSCVQYGVYTTGVIYMSTTNIIAFRSVIVQRFKPKTLLLFDTFMLIYINDSSDVLVFKQLIIGIEGLLDYRKSYHFQYQIWWTTLFFL